MTLADSATQIPIPIAVLAVAAVALMAAGLVANLVKNRRQSRPVEAVPNWPETRPFPPPRDFEWE